MMRIEHRKYLVKNKPVDREYSALFHAEQGNCDIDAKNNIRFPEIKNEALTSQIVTL